MNINSIIFIGDDSWLSMYPEFNRSYPLPSFNIRDLDTVDNGCHVHILEELKNNDYDMLISHSLGVDHVGHRFSADHPQMKRKLIHIDKIVEDIIQNMDNNSLFLMFGDHGMTAEGNHGGESKEEVEGGIFIYSKKGLYDSDGDERFAEVCCMDKI